MTIRAFCIKWAPARVPDMAKRREVGDALFAMFTVARYEKFGPAVHAAAVVFATKRLAALVKETEAQLEILHE